MKSKLVKKVICLTVIWAMTAGFAACGSKTDTESATSEKTTKAVATEASKEVTKDTQEVKQVAIKLFSNLPDRNAGQGKLEQMLIDNYIKENPNVKIEVEALQDEPYKQKFKAYTASDNLPDLFSVWGQPAFISPVINSGFAAELNAGDYENYGFFPGSTDGFSANGKLYGLPRNTDVMVLYYNKDIFAKNGVKVPETLKELIDASKAFRAKKIAPCAINGKDKWSIAILYNDFVLKASGDTKLISNAINKATTFAKEEGLLKGAQYLKELMTAKFFQDSFTAADYGAARNMFAQGKAAMYYMGSWEMGMVTDESLPEGFRKNIGVLRFPVIDGGKGKATDIMAWNGGGYSVAAKSQVKDEAIKLLNYIYKPENWAKNAWQMGLCIPAQKYDAYLTGKETEVQKELTRILSEATALGGTPWNDLGTPAFKTDSEDLSQRLAAGVITPDKFIDACDKALNK